jgi:hypothetical protein
MGIIHPSVVEKPVFDILVYERWPFGKAPHP